MLKVAGKYTGWFMIASSTCDAEGETAMSAQTTRNRGKAMRFDKRYQAERMSRHLMDTYGLDTTVVDIGGLWDAQG